MIYCHPEAFEFKFGRDKYRNRMTNLARMYCASREDPENWRFRRQCPGSSRPAIYNLLFLFSVCQYYSNI